MLHTLKILAKRGLHKQEFVVYLMGTPFRETPLCEGAHIP